MSERKKGLELLAALGLLKGRLSEAAQSGLAKEPAQLSKGPPAEETGRAPRKPIDRSALTPNPRARTEPISRPVQKRAYKASAKHNSTKLNHSTSLGVRPTRGTPTDFAEFRTAKNPVAAPSTDPATFRGAKALAYVTERVNAKDVSHLIAAPPSMGAKALAEIDRTVSCGREILTARPKPDGLGFVVGFDFGTSASKIVVHQPGAGELAYALPVPIELQATDGGLSQEHLWRSTVWFDPERETFSLAPARGAVAIEGFKTGLIQSEGNRMPAMGLTHSQATTAYLALMLAYLLGHHRLAAPAGFDRAAHFGRVHFGVPVACKEDSKCADEFSRVIDAAFRLAAVSGDITLSAVKAALSESGPASEPGKETPFVIFEELAAVIAGYCASRERRFGPHMVVDVGASTLDVATFYIPEGDNPIPVYMSGVELLGAHALTAARRNNVPDETFKAACAAHTSHVLSNTHLKKNASFAPMNGVAKPLLFVGGGRLTDVHSALYERYHEGLEAPLQTPAPGRNLKCDKSTDFARLLLAWGLAQQEVELPILRPPSQVEGEMRSRRDYTDKYTDSSMM